MFFLSGKKSVLCMCLCIAVCSFGKLCLILFVVLLYRVPGCIHIKQVQLLYRFLLQVFAKSLSKSKMRTSSEQLIQEEES